MASAETMDRDIQDQFREGADKARERINDMTKKIKSRSEDAWEDVIEMVKKHPGKALGITLAAGFAVGTLASMGSRRRYSATDQVKDLAGTGADAWERVTSGFEDAVCTLKDAVNDAVKKFR